MSIVRSFWHSPVLMNRAASLFFGLASLALVAIVTSWMANRPVFMIKRVLLDPAGGELLHVNAQQIQLALNETVSGTVLSTDLKSIHRAVQALPWVRQATVRRVWPNRLLIRVEEHVSVASWPEGRLVNSQGETFAAMPNEHRASCRLVKLSGPDGTHAFVLERARQLSQWFAPMGLGLQSLVLSEQYAWTARLTGGLTIELGRDTLPTSMEERVRLFVTTQPWLARQQGMNAPVANLSSADLRYATGYAFREAAVPREIPEQNTPICIERQA